MSAGTSPGAVSRPASINKTRRDASSDRRAASAAPAEPAPTTTTSASRMSVSRISEWPIWLRSPARLTTAETYVVSRRRRETTYVSAVLSRAGDLSHMGYSDVRETDIREADVVVVGAGSAGAALAARLSEDASRRVLLIEAGRDTAPGEVPADIRNIFPAAYINSDYFWPGLATSFRKGEAPVPFLQPRVMGGGSSVMGMIALRGLPGDYDVWEQMGARNWGWRDVLPTFQAITDDRDAAVPDRNVRGPNIVRRLPRASWPTYMHRIEEVLMAQGVPSHANAYETDDDGFFQTPLSQDYERATSARCYLTAETRARPNLEILCETRVLRVLFDGQRVTGILAERA